MSLPFPQEYKPVKLPLYAHIDFFFFLPVLSPKIAYSAQLLSCFQGNENGARHCGSFNANHSEAGCASRPREHCQTASIQDSLTVPGSTLPYICSLSFPTPLSPSCKPNGTTRWVSLSPFYREEKLRYKTIKCLYKG